MVKIQKYGIINHIKYERGYLPMTKSILTKYVVLSAVSIMTMCFVCGCSNKTDTSKGTNEQANSEQIQSAVANDELAALMAKAKESPNEKTSLTKEQVDAGNFEVNTNFAIVDDTLLINQTVLASDSGTCGNYSYDSTRTGDTILIKITSTIASKPEIIAITGKISVVGKQAYNINARGVVNPDETTAYNVSGAFLMKNGHVPATTLIKNTTGEAVNLYISTIMETTCRNLLGLR